MYPALNDPAQFERWKRVILTCKGTRDSPAGGCGVGCDSWGQGTTDATAYFLCVAGAKTPMDWEEIGNLVLTRGDRTDTLRY